MDWSSTTDSARFAKPCKEYCEAASSWLPATRKIAGTGSRSLNDYAYQSLGNYDNFCRFAAVEGGADFFIGQCMLAHEII